MKKRWLVIALLAAAFSCWWGFNAVRYHYGTGNALARAIAWPLESTRWADGFSEDNFDRVKIGMREADVISIVGEPLRKTCSEWCELVYTWQTDSTADFDWRSVEVGKDGRVERIRRDFFID